ncbi:MAG: hypothetical protein ACUVTL_01850 [Thermoproteota archaeon]
MDESTIWSVYLDREKLSLEERLSLNQYNKWVTENNQGIICITSWYFYEVDEVVSNEYDVKFQIYDDLLKKEKWEKYRKEVPGLIAELEAAERIANEMNQKYGSNIKLAGQRPFLETCFDSKA